MGSTNSLIYRGDIINSRAINAVIGIFFFIVATTLGAYVRIPIAGSPVPITLQTFFVILSGAVLGKRLGIFSQLGYILLGAMGLPIFQGYSFGLAHIFGPTGGYIVGFIFAAFFIGKTIQSRNFNIYQIAVYFAIGDLIIHSCGTFWLIAAYKINVYKAVSIGMLLFIPGEIVKIFFASIIYSKMRARSKRIFFV